MRREGWVAAVAFLAGAGAVVVFGRARQDGPAPAADEVTLHPVIRSGAGAQGSPDVRSGRAPGAAGDGGDGAEGRGDRGGGGNGTSAGSPDGAPAAAHPFPRPGTTGVGATGPGNWGGGEDDGDPPAPARFATDAGGIRDAVGSALPDVKECYDEWLRMRPDLAGTLKVAFTIAASEDDPETGEVRDVHLEDTSIGHVLMEGCVQAVLSDLSFEPPKEPVSVTYPFRFSAE